MKFNEVKNLLEGVPYLGLDQGYELYHFILREKPTKILELGHAHGCSTIYMAAALDEIGEGVVDTVDLKVSEELIPNIEGLAHLGGLSKYINIHREKNSYTWFLKKKIEEQTNQYNCDPYYDFCFIDGPKNWTIDGLAFFAADKLIKNEGWLLFDDYGWTYKKALRRKEVTDGVVIRDLSDDQAAQSNVEQIYQLLVRQHPQYTNFEVQSNCWAWAQKFTSQNMALSKLQDTSREIGDLTKFAMANMAKKKSRPPIMNAL